MLPAHAPAAAHAAEMRACNFLLNATRSGGGHAAEPRRREPLQFSVECYLLFRRTNSVPVPNTDLQFSVECYRDGVEDCAARHREELRLAIFC